MTEDLATRPAPGKRRALIVLAGLGVLVYMGGALATDASRLLAALRQLGWQGSGLVLLLSLLNYLLRFHRWTLYLEALGHQVPLARNLSIYLGGFAFTVSPAKTGEAVRSLYLRGQGVRYPESIAALFVERLLDLLAMALLASLIVLEQAAYWPVLAGSMTLTIGLFAIIGLPGLARRIAALAGRRHGRIAEALSGLASLLLSSQRLLRPRLLLSGLLLGLLAWSAEGIGFHLICGGLDFKLATTNAIGIYAIAALAGGAAFFLPGGIGSMEIVMTSLLVAAGASLPLAVIATLMCRLATLWFAVLIGLLATALLEARPRDQIAHVPP